MDGGPPSFIHGDGHTKFERCHGERHLAGYFSEEEVIGKYRYDPRYGNVGVGYSRRSQVR
jgi:hypothetical protein